MGEKKKQIHKYERVRTSVDTRSKNTTENIHITTIRVGFERRSNYLMRHMKKKKIFGID